MVIFDDIEKHKDDLFMEYPITFTDAVGYPCRWWSGYEVGRLVDLLKNEFDIDVDCVSVE
ncbi:hypothetical protein [Butyrivibrio fibrisolvens]|uniref:hypothetical protein n=1 Tax=Butyrivibrio fibrisolvens TaxID=831 RepID=UPI00040EF3B4|nr:hypothetical protein [Butyrivibrio fibrisolvens]